jgi:hypothetical protein
VELGDGTRCSFQSFDKLKAPATSALDQYERSKEAKPAEKPSGTDGEAKPAGKPSDTEGEAKPKS